jgi:hypothetical protein
MKRIVLHSRIHFHGEARWHATPPKWRHLLFVQQCEASNGTARQGLPEIGMPSMIGDPVAFAGTVAMLAREGIYRYNIRHPLASHDD